MTTRLYIFVAVTFLSGVAFLWQAAQFPPSHEVSTLVGPRTWPFGVLVLMLVLVVMMGLLLWAKGPEAFTDLDSKTADAGPEADDAVVRYEAPGSRWRHLVILVLTLSYTLVMTLTGYLVATALFAALATVTLGERRPLRIALNTAIAAAIVALVFDRLLNIPLP